MFITDDFERVTVSRKRINQINNLYK